MPAACPDCVAHLIARSPPAPSQRLHNNSYALGFSLIQNVFKFVFMPLSLFGAFFCGMWVAFWSTARYLPLIIPLLLQL